MTIRTLSLVVCGAGPASDVATLIDLARDEGWRVQVIVTPAALNFIDATNIEEQTGSPVRSEYSPPGSPRSVIPQAIIVAPATYNTINKWAQGISDTYALGILAEAPGLNIPVVVLPYVNSALASREAFIDSVARLRREGVHMMLGTGGIEPHQPRSGGSQASAFPWHIALKKVDSIVDSA